MQSFAIQFLRPVEWLVVCCPEGVAPGEALVVETASGQSVEVLVPEVSTALSD